jgi:phosphonopyruvate decarboxylase
VNDHDSLDEALKTAKDMDELSLIEVKCALGARADLGRPTTTALDNKKNFMDYLRD